MTLESDEFLRRFCLHVLPKSFVRVQPFGIRANCHRAEKLALSRQLFSVRMVGPTADTPHYTRRPLLPHRSPQLRVPELVDAALKWLQSLGRRAVLKENA